VTQEARRDQERRRATSQLCVQRSDWNGHVTTPKGGRLRYVPLTIRLAAAVRDHRHLRCPNVLCQDDGQPLTRQMVQYRVLRASRRAKLSAGRRAHPASSCRTWRCAERRRERFRSRPDTGNWA
jgi:integrase